jgi:histidyl-tRNA synthetase
LVWTLQLNSLGSSYARALYREKLVHYFEQHHDQLDEDSRRRLLSNPLRILDSKNPDLAQLIAAAPKLTEHLDDESRAHFDALCAQLDAAGVRYQINPCLVRGLDYYGRTVFEWVTDKLGAQGTVCAGGRFDGLVEQLGGKATPAIGFAIGLERLTALLDEGTVPLERYRPHVYLVRVGEAAQQHALLLAERLRDEVPGLRVQLNHGGGSFKNQLKRADKSGATLALVMGEEEAVNGSVGIKSLREQAEQQTLTLEQIVPFLRDYVTGTN